jgi:hypothetical protein
MGPNVVLFGWNRPIPGRERMSAEHFRTFTQYLEKAKKNGAIQSFETVFLNHHGGDLNGFFLIRVEPSKMPDLLSSEEWQIHMMRAEMHLQGSGAVTGQTGELVAKMFDLWSKEIPA